MHVGRVLNSNCGCVLVLQGMDMYIPKTHCSLTPIPPAGNPHSNCTAELSNDSDGFTNAGLATGKMESTESCGPEGYKVRSKVSGLQGDAGSDKPVNERQTKAGAHIVKSEKSSSTEPIADSQDLHEKESDISSPVSHAQTELASDDDLCEVASETMEPEVCYLYSPSF